VRLLRSAAASHPELAEQILTEANYFESNKERMRYPEFRKQGLFVGSGVIEAGCTTALGRLKRSGMFWTVRGANAIIVLRCCELSGRFEDYWESRRARPNFKRAAYLIAEFAGCLHPAQETLEHESRRRDSEQWGSAKVCHVSQPAAEWIFDKPCTNNQPLQGCGVRCG
jgi:hypothetical protein